MSVSPDRSLQAQAAPVGLEGGVGLVGAGVGVGGLHCFFTQCLATSKLEEYIMQSSRQSTSMDLPRR
jgi:hypothetical protein